MAFEDRCSPQSAPSPPGVPHSPHNTAMICSDVTSTSSLSTSPEMAVDVCSDRVSPILVKQEDDTTARHQETPIRFSITNILSNNFGKINRKTSGERKVSLFRPYDTEPKDIRSSSPPTKPAEDLTENSVHYPVQPKFNAVLDYSNRAHSFFHTNNNLEHAKFLQYYSHHHSQFNLAAASTLYPRLHEDILNSKKYQQYCQPAPLLSESAISKIPPLGNLCKTVSQIGQPAANKSPVSTPVKKTNHGTSEMAERLEAASNMHQKEQQQKTQQTNNLDSGLESSDDTKSETGSTKDENGSQLWPAWIYCTRYSDRPSSGRYQLHAPTHNPQTY